MKLIFDKFRAKMSIVVSFFLFFCTFFKTSAMDIISQDTENSNSNWELITDQVMGGVSEGTLTEEIEDGKKFFRLEGIVSTKNNGGFIQFRSKSIIKENDFKGIRLETRGAPGEYFVHLRTNYTFLPWQYYSGKFVVTENWKEVNIMFEEFEKSNFYQPSKFVSSEITSIGFVAFGKDFNAKLDIKSAQWIKD